MNILNTTSLESNKRVKINFAGGDLSSDAGLFLIKELHTTCSIGSAGLYWPLILENSELIRSV